MTRYAKFFRTDGARDKKKRKRRGKLLVGLGASAAALGLGGLVVLKSKGKLGKAAKGLVKEADSTVPVKSVKVTPRYNAKEKDIREVTENLWKKNDTESLDDILYDITKDIKPKNKGRSVAALPEGQPKKVIGLLPPAKDSNVSINRPKEYIGRLETAVENTKTTSKKRRTPRPTKQSTNANSSGILITPPKGESSGILRQQERAYNKGLVEKGARSYTDSLEQLNLYKEGVKEAKQKIKKSQKALKNPNLSKNEKLAHEIAIRDANQDIAKLAENRQITSDAIKTFFGNSFNRNLQRTIPEESRKYRHLQAVLPDRISKAAAQSAKDDPVVQRFIRNIKGTKKAVNQQQKKVEQLKTELIAAIGDDYKYDKLRVQLHKAQDRLDLRLAKANRVNRRLRRHMATKSKENNFSAYNYLATFSKKLVGISLRTKLKRMCK